MLLRIGLMKSHLRLLALATLTLVVAGFLIQNSAASAQAAPSLIIPATGHVTAVVGSNGYCPGYGRSGSHDGIDIAQWSGSSTVIVAAAGGTVTAAGSQASYGNYVVIDHGSGYTTRYYHMVTGSILVSVGQTVSQGQQIGTMGATGDATGVHLHFQLNYQGVAQSSLDNYFYCGRDVIRGDTISGGSAAGVTAFEANTTSLYAGPDGSYVNTSLGMASGTNPSIATNNSSWIAAIQANTGNLYVYSPNGGGINLAQGMAANTSPSITFLDNGSYAIAFQSNVGQLNIYLSTLGYSVNTQAGMASGTSPAIIPRSGGNYLVAFEANTNQLYTYASSTGLGNSNQGMMAGTSPAVTATSAGYQVAFQANNAELFTWGSSTGGDTGIGMASGTSPSIGVSSNGGWVAAAESNTNNLWVYASATGGTDTNQGMQGGTSPSIKGNTDGTYRIAFQSNVGQLNIYGSGGGNTGQGMASGTSPSVG